MLPEELKNHKKPPIQNNNMNQRQTYRMTINQYLPRQSTRSGRKSERGTFNPRQTVDEDDDSHLIDNDDDSNDEYT